MRNFLFFPRVIQFSSSSPVFPDARHSAWGSWSGETARGRKHYHESWQCMREDLPDESHRCCPGPYICGFRRERRLSSRALPLGAPWQRFPRAGRRWGASISGPGSSGIPPPTTNRTPFSHQIACRAQPAAPQQAPRKIDMQQHSRPAKQLSNAPQHTKYKRVVS